MTRTEIRPTRSAWIVAAATFALLLAACGEDSAGPTATTEPVESLPATDGDGDGGAGELTAEGFEGPLTVAIPNSPGTLTTSGRMRVMTALIGDGPNSYLGGPSQPVTVRFRSSEGDTVGEVEGTWLTTNASELGLYVTYYEFDGPGLWEVDVSADGAELGSTLIEVVEESSIPNIGEPAPASQTPTGSTAEEIEAISTDQEPDPDLYDLTIAEAVGNGRPTVIAFATPAFCRTALCGPTLDTVKAVTGGRADLDVVHVEPFDLELAPQGTLEPIPPMLDWGLATEPWVFVVDADGLVTATFEGIIGQAELEAALAPL